MLGGVPSPVINAGQRTREANKQVGVVAAGSGPAGTEMTGFVRANMS